MRNESRGFQENRGTKNDIQLGNKRPWEQNIGSISKGRPGSNTGAVRSEFQARLQCKKYGRFHVGNCMDGSLVCYNCGKKGHYARSCPNQKKKLTPTNKQQRTNAHVYSLYESEVAAGPSTVVTDQLPITNLSLYTLIDSGATHSFIASRLVDKLDWRKETLSQPFFTATPAGDLYESNS